MKLYFVSLEWYFPITLLTQHIVKQALNEVEDPTLYFVGCFSKICSYKKCDISCSTEVYKPPENYDKSTINYDLLNNVIDKLTKFIKSQYYTSNLGVYTFNDLKDNIDNQYPSEIIEVLDGVREVYKKWGAKT